MAPTHRLRGEYLVLSIIPTGSRPKRSSTSLIALGALLALGAGLVVIFG
jgi:hypothetical protein